MFKRIQAARERLKVTPMSRDCDVRTLNRMVGAEVYFKCENFQRVGAFKFRGAFNSISQLSGEEKARVFSRIHPGIMPRPWPWSAVAGIQTTIVMPNDAPATKRAATEGYGQRLSNTTRETNPGGGCPKHPSRGRPDGDPAFDHEEVVAGQGQRPGTV